MEPLFFSPRRTWWMLLIFGIIAVIFGLSAFFAPAATAMAMVWAFGIMALAEGIISVIALFNKNTEGSRTWLLLYAVASILFGVIAVINPIVTAGVLLMFLAAWLLVAGVYRIILAIRIRKQIEGEWMIALSGVLAIILGILFVVSPGGGIVAVTLWVGVLALIYGILQIVAAFRLRALIK